MCPQLNTGEDEILIVFCVSKHDCYPWKLGNITVKCKMASSLVSKYQITKHGGLTAFKTKHL